MTDSQTDQVWPKWVRYPLIAVLGAFPVYGLILIVTTEPGGAAAAGLRVALSVGIATVVTALVGFVTALGSRPRRRREAALQSSGPSTDAERDRAFAEWMNRRLAASTGEVAEAYNRARALQQSLAANGYPEWADRIDTAMQAPSPHTALSGLLWVLVDLREVPDLGQDLRDGAETVRADVATLLGMRE